MSESYASSKKSDRPGKDVKGQRSGFDLAFRVANPAHSFVPAFGKRESYEKFLEVNENTYINMPTEDSVLFSDVVKRSKSDASNKYYKTGLEFCYKLEGPQVQALPIADESQRPGFVPISTAFHFQSNRERVDDDDDGLDDPDIAAVDGVATRRPQSERIETTVRVKQEERGVSKRHSFIYEAIRLIKGDFVFPHRTYRPKVQVAYRVPPGQMPQAVVIERLHRLYIKADIDKLLTNLGITQYDLMPVPHYGETNERFYQEMQWRNRIRINGVDKREFMDRYIKAKNAADAFEKKSNFPQGNTNEGSKAGSNANLKGKRRESGAGGEGYPYPEEDGEEGHGEGRWEEKDKNNLASEDNKDELPPPFGPMFPLDYFDNEEFDIRTGEEWMYLGWDWKDQKMYPIPAKAYLPIRLDTSKSSDKLTTSRNNFRRSSNNSNKDGIIGGDDTQAISQLTAMNLLTKTERLDRFRRWLLEGRYRRLNPTDKQKENPDDADLTAFARATTTVANFMSPSDEENSSEKESSSTEDEDHGVTQSTSMFDVHKIFSVETNKELAADSSVFDISGSESDFLSQFKKIEKTNLGDGENVVQEVKRSASLLTDIFSDPDSIPMSPDAESMANVTKGNELHRSNSNVSADRQQSMDDLRLGGILKNVIAPESDYGMGINMPTSPDIDPYEDGYEDLVFDYDKMKRVHNYDWRWVEVAVFKYDPSTRKYFVRTIYPPVIFAWLSKLYLLMDAEDPNKHAERIRDAVKRRYEIENIMRYNLYVDCLPTERAKSIPANYMKIILMKILDTPKLEYQDQTLKRIQKEIDLEFKRSHLMLEFNHIVEKHPKLYQPWVKIPPPFVNWGNGSTQWKKLKARQSEPRSFSYKIARIQKLSVIYKKEPYESLVEIMSLCLQARERTLLLYRRSTPIYIDDFKQLQKSNCEEIIQYMKDDWMEEVMGAIRKHLSKIPHSWYNIRENRWDVYTMSKTSNYLNLVKYIMEDTLRYVTEESILNFVAEIEDLTDDCDVDNTYDWGEDLIKSEFLPPEGMTPPFLLSLFMDNDGPKYTSLLSKYPKVLTALFDSVVGSSATLPDIVPKIMSNLLFGVNSQLSSVELQEPHIKRLKARLLRALRRGLLPVDKYAQKYRRYQKIWNLDMPNFFVKYESENHTASEVKKAVELHNSELAKLELEIPASVDIACFRIDVDVVKQGLLKKKKQLVTGMLEQFASKLHQIVHKIREDYQEMERKLNTRSDDIAEVMELKMYVETIPSEVKTRAELITKIMKDYEMFEKFSYAIPNEDFETKWSAAMWSGKILKMADDAIAWLDDDYDRLLKVQQSDMVALSDAVDSAFLAVAGLAAYVELDRAAEVGLEVKKIWKQVKELIEQNILLNSRQKIFGLPDLQNEALERLVRDIEPFKSLWFTAADWLKIQDVVFKETMDKIDMRMVIKLINEGGQIIRRCVRYFKGADAIQHIAEEVRFQIEEFKPIVPLITTLKNSGMRQRHWEAISDVCGFTVVAKGNQNFKALLDQGMRKHVNEIAEIGNLATNEFAIETKLEKMFHELNKLTILTVVDPSSGVVVIELSSPKALPFLAECIRITDEFQENPYKMPFEERINVWEKKIKLAQENVFLWQDNQKDWVELQPHFTAPDAATRMPPEHKMFVKMERIWRRLNRLVRDKPEIIEIGSDSTVRASLLQFKGLVTKVKKGLEEYMRPHGSSSDDDEPGPKTEPVPGAEGTSSKRSSRDKSAEVKSEKEAASSSKRSSAAKPVEVEVEVEVIPEKEVEPLPPSQPNDEDPAETET